MKTDLVGGRVCGTPLWLRCSCRFGLPLSLAGRSLVKNFPFYGLGITESFINQTRSFQMKMFISHVIMKRSSYKLPGCRRFRDLRYHFPDDQPAETGPLGPSLNAARTMGWATCRDQ